MLAHQGTDLRGNPAQQALIFHCIPQGCVLSPLLFVVYTKECQGNRVPRFVLKYTDDSVVVSLLQGVEQEVQPGP